MGLVVGTAALAQDKVETTIAADVVTGYVWRGQDLGSAAVQPTLGIGYEGLSLSAWGSYGLVDPADTKELDLTLSYTIGGLTGSPCECRGGARLYSQVIVGESGLETC